MKDYSKLQNGSDIRGVSMEGVEGEPVDLTIEAAADIGSAFVSWLSQRIGKPASAIQIAVGADSRLSAADILDAVAGGIVAAGADCADCGMASTPAMFMATVFPECNFDAGIMVTASHLPWNRNGMKFFANGTGLEKHDITSILEKAAEANQASKSGKLRSFDLMTPYCNHLRAIIKAGIGGDSDKPLAGFKIAVDAGNGAGGFFATDVLEPLGADISASQYLEPDGKFPNHVPNPELQSVMEEVKDRVVENQCDLGITFDTDVDRSAAVDEKGMILNRNRLIALLARIVSEEHPGCTIVTDSVTSDHLTKFIVKMGCVHHRFKRGYRNVINEAIRLNKEGVNCPLAVETSGHCAFSENYFLDDGAFLATKLVIETVKARQKGHALSSLIESLRDPAEAEEYRLQILAENPKTYGSEVLQSLRGLIANQPSWRMAAVNYEGVRVSIPVHNGWFLIRMSLHDPIMPLNVESDMVGGLQKIIEELKPLLEKHTKLVLPF